MLHLWHFSKQVFHLISEPDPPDEQDPLLRVRQVQYPDPVVAAVAVLPHGDQAQVVMADPGNLKRRSKSHEYLI